MLKGVFMVFLSFFAIACKNQKQDSYDTALAGNNGVAQDSISIDKLLDTVQQQTINYFWEGGNPDSGLAPERIHIDNIYPTNDKNSVTTGGTGFGLMALITGIERGFIPKKEGFERFCEMVDFLAKADRFHGAWPHWLDGTTGKMKPFGKKDNGGDLVETAFLVQGLLTVREYYKDGNEAEKKLAAAIQKLWEEVEWDWYTNGQDVLYWHWSPEYQWEMNFQVEGYNECLVMYVLAASSPTHSISKKVYDKGWARDAAITKDTVMYGMRTILDHYPGSDKQPVGPLFWAHYSYLGLSPKGLKDQYADYWELNKNHAMIQYKYAVNNPKGYKGYGKDMWGLTSSYSVNGYAGHNPTNDLGVIAPTAALSSMPYTPEQSQRFLEYMYTKEDSLIGKYGPYDAFSLEYDWYVPRYLAIDQGPIPVMIENYRTGLLWDLFMINGDVQNGLKKLGFASPYLN